MVDYEMKYRDLADRVMTLLDRQKQYYKTRDNAILRDCKEREKNLHKECREIVYAKVTGKAALRKENMYEEKGIDPVWDFL